MGVEEGKPRWKIDWFDLLAIQGTLESSPTPQFSKFADSSTFTASSFRI